MLSGRYYENDAAGDVGFFNHERSLQKFGIFTGKRHDWDGENDRRIPEIPVGIVQNTLVITIEVIRTFPCRPCRMQIPGTPDCRMQSAGRNSGTV